MYPCMPIAYFELRMENSSYNGLAYLLHILENDGGGREGGR